MTDVPAGAVLAHTLYGAPKEDVRSAYEAAGSQPAPSGGLPYVDDELIEAARAERRIEKREEALERMADKRCTANDGQCKGWRLKGSEFCVYHDPEARAKSLEARRRRGDG